MSNKRDELKLTLLGEATTGKTCISYRLVKNKFYDGLCSTIGASFMTYDSNDIRFMVWDTAGQERFKSIMTMYYRDADIVLLVFDVTRLETFGEIKEYLKKLYNTLSNEYKIIIIGNKIDLLKDMSITTIDDYVKKELLDLYFYETIKDKLDYTYISAKTAENFQTLKEKIGGHGKILLKTKVFRDNENDKNIIRLHNGYNNNDNSYWNYCAC